MEVRLGPRWEPTHSVPCDRLFGNTSRPLIVFENPSAHCGYTGSSGSATQLMLPRPLEATWTDPARFGGPHGTYGSRLAGGRVAHSRARTSVSRSTGAILRIRRSSPPSASVAGTPSMS